MNTNQKLEIEHKLTYFDVVWALDEGLAISGTLVASDSYQLNSAIRALYEWMQRWALDPPVRRAGAGRRRSAKKASTHLRQWQVARASTARCAG